MKPPSGYERSRTSLAGELTLSETTLNRGGTTSVPESVIGALGLKVKAGERSKLLWMIRGKEVVVAKGTPQSDWRKTMLRKNGTVAIPRHIQQALKLEFTSGEERSLLWTRRGNEILVRKARHA